jgi:hypothetical protein
MLAVFDDGSRKRLCIAIFEPRIEVPQAVNVEHPLVYFRPIREPAAGMRPVHGKIFVHMMHFAELSMRDRDEDIAGSFIPEMAWRIAPVHVPEQNTRIVKEWAEVDDIFDRGVVLFAPIEKPMWLVSGALVHLNRVAGAYSEIGVGLQERDLLLQPMRISPIVIALKYGEIVTGYGF